MIFLREIDDRLAASKLFINPWELLVLNQNNVAAVLRLQNRNTGEIKELVLTLEQINFLINMEE